MKIATNHFVVSTHDCKSAGCGLYALAAGVGSADTDGLKPILVRRGQVRQPGFRNALRSCGAGQLLALNRAQISRGRGGTCNEKVWARNYR